MSDHLDDAQTEVLATYQSITGEENTTRSIRELRAHNWDLNVSTAQHSPTFHNITFNVGRCTIKNEPHSHL